MAVTFEVAHTRGTVYLFDPADIVINGNSNGRGELPDITELKASIRANGQIEPVLVRNEANRPVLVIGFSRWRSIVELNKEDPTIRIKIKATYVRCNEIEGLALNYEENKRRNPISALDEAHLFDRFEKYNWTHKEISERLKVPISTIKDRLALIEATPEVQEAVRTKRLTPSAAAKIAKLATAVQRDAVKGNGHVSKEAVATATGKVSKPSLKLVREFVDRFDGPGVDDDTRKIIREIIAFMDGQA